MKKKTKNILTTLLLLFILKETFYHSELILKTVNLSIDLWIKNIVPSLFPFMILSDILINYKFIDYICKYIGKPLQKLFKVKKESIYVFIISILTGSPNNATYLKQLYTQKQLNEKEITKIISFSHFSNPLFILGTVSVIFLANKKIGLIIFISQIISNILIGILLRKKFISNDISKTYYEQNNQSLTNILQNSIIKNINTLLLILGILTICMIITAILFENIRLTLISECLLRGSIELTQGLKCTSLLPINIKYRAAIMSSLISFGGISIHMQIKAILNDIQFHYKYFLLARILQAMISSVIVLVLI